MRASTNRALRALITASALGATGLTAAQAATTLLTAQAAIHTRGPVPAPAACDGAFATPLNPLPAASMDARAVWLDATRLRWPQAVADGRFRLVHAARGGIVAAPGERVRGADTALTLQVDASPLPPALAERFKWVGAGLTLAVRPADRARLPALHRGELLLVEEDAQGLVRQATATQIAGALDDLYAAAELAPDLGVTVSAHRTQFRLWAPTARKVTVCLHDDARRPARAVLVATRHAATGVWQAAVPRDLSGGYFTYLVDVYVRGTGLVRNRVTDPYSLSLNTDSQRSWIGSLDAAVLKPPGWDAAPRPDRVKAATDQVIYELHVRDFSVGDATVAPAHRGKYLAFTDARSDGMKHLRAMAAAGVTDLHLLPVFDLASVPESGCTSPDPAALAREAPDSAAQQAAAAAQAAGDCFNWGYDPWHFTAPEGSYASDASDGAVRVLEFRSMVQALHAARLRVGMDMVYNHTTASGQHAKSVLDRIVPGYYQRLNAAGKVEMSTCCDNTATENRMMARLMIDSAVVWARDYRIDSMRFDLMGHQPRAAMERLQQAVNRAAGRPIHLIGEGWNFGEVKDGARFVQASQLSLNGSGIGSFSDRGRDAARGGGCCDNAEQTLSRQGWLNGLFYDPNPSAKASRDELLRAADLVRVGLAGTLAGYRMTTHDGSVKALAEIDYAGQRAGFASQPDEVVNYVENHDNPTLFDINVLKLPPGTSREDRARVQVLGIALTAFSQGIAYYHAGIELLRSKSGDRNSFDSGDWFNRLDWTFSDNFWGTGLPPQKENGTLWPALKPLLADPGIKPTPAEIRFTRDAFYDLLKIRASTTMLRLRTAEDVTRRLTLHNTGANQVPTLMVGHVDGRGLAGASFAELLYALNADRQPATIDLTALKGRDFKLHPVHRASTAADPRPAAQARWDAATGTLTVPPRTALAFVLE